MSENFTNLRHQAEGGEERRKDVNKCRKKQEEKKDEDQQRKNEEREARIEDVRRNKEDEEVKSSKEGGKRGVKTNVAGMIIAKKNEDKARTLHKHSVDDKGFMRDKSRNIGLGQHDIERVLRECQRKGGDQYPSEEVIQMFRRTMEGLEVRERRVAAMSKMKVRGLYLKKGYKIKKGMVIGVYGGKLTIGIGAYVLQLEYEEGGQFRVDTEGAEDGLRIFGMMNEDIHGGEVNAHLEEMGLIRAVQNMVGPCEILTEYGDEYDWDEIKWIGYTALKEEMTEMEGWVSEMKARNMKEARKGNKLEKHMAKIVDGELEAEELHSTTPTLEEGNSLESMLTTGAKMEHFSFRKFGGERKVYENKDIGRNDKRLSGVKRYAKKWLGEETIRCDFKEVRRLNANVNTTCNIIGEIRRSFGGGELGNQSNMIEDVRKQMETERRSKEPKEMIDVDKNEEGRYE
jgi:GNAT superfamily N-acetyltransferase